MRSLPLGKSLLTRATNRARLSQTRRAAETTVQTGRAPETATTHTLDTVGGGDRSSTPWAMQVQWAIQVQTPRTMPKQLRRLSLPRASHWTCRGHATSTRRTLRQRRHPRWDREILFRGSCYTLSQECSSARLQLVSAFASMPFVKLAAAPTTLGSLRASPRGTRRATSASSHPSASARRPRTTPSARDADYVNLQSSHVRVHFVINSRLKRLEGSPLLFCFAVRS